MEGMKEKTNRYAVHYVYNVTKMKTKREIEEAQFIILQRLIQVNLGILVSLQNIHSLQKKASFLMYIFARLLRYMLYYEEEAASNAF